MKNAKHILIFLISSFLLFSCTSERELVEFEPLNSQFHAPDFNTESANADEEESRMPAVWRGRKLFSSPWAYIYAKNREAAEYAYDQLEEVADDKKKSTFGLVFVTSSQDKETAFEYKKLIHLYENLLNSKQIHEAEKPIFEEDLKGLKKVEEFHNLVNKKADEKKEENDLDTFRESIDEIITLATFFIQPEIMESVMGSTIDKSVYWCAFISVDDAIDERMDEVVSSIMTDYDISTVGRGLIWGIISPGFYFRKRAVISQTQEYFEKGYKKNAANTGVVSVTEKAADAQLPATVNGSE